VALAPTQEDQPVHAQHWVNGSTDSSAPHRVRPVIDPAIGTTTGDFPVADSDVVDRAVRAAAAAAPGWWALGWEERARLLLEVAERIAAAANDLAVLESREMGKPVAMAREDIEGSVEVVRDAARAAGSFFATEPAGGGLRPRRLLDLLADGVDPNAQDSVRWMCFCCFMVPPRFVCAHVSRLPTWVWCVVFYV
jgi:delta 1-pyrroline-5-carboxylate dehydrogenase